MNQAMNLLEREHIRSINCLAASHNKSPRARIHKYIATPK